MDIKTRIDGLTEQEAKDALEWCITTMGGRIPCDYCEQAIFSNAGGFLGCGGGKKSCTSHWLDEALKEARHERI